MSSRAAHDLSVHLADLLRRERVAMADFLLALAEFDRRRLWLDLGYPGLFMFLHRRLGLSKGAAHFRKVAAELVQRFPDVIEPLRDGRLCLTSVVELAKVATRENLAQVLPRFFHCSRREAQVVAVEISPAKAVPLRDVMTPARAVNGAPSADQQTGPGPAPVLLGELKAPARVAPLSLPLPGRRDEAQPLTADLRRLHITVSRRFAEKLERARSALSHMKPRASAEEILEAGLDLVLAEHARRKGATRHPRKSARKSKPEHIPAAVKREVWKRDGGRCQWPIADEIGGVCGSTRKVEFDHVRPRSRGGASGPEQVRLLCRVHQVLAARLAFGDRWMDRYTREAKRSSPGP